MGLPLDELRWDSFNEGSHMELYFPKYRGGRFVYYPAELLADKIYWSIKYACSEFRE